MTTPEPFTIGVEEEFQIVDARTFALRPRGERIVEAARRVLGDEVQPELQLSQVEIGTPICSSLPEVRTHLQRLRRAVAEAAAAEGSCIAATGTHPFSEWLGQGITPKPRYLGIAEAYQHLASEQLVCGCHVHVAVSDPDVAIRVLDWSRPWLAVLLALSANSPFWEGVDTGYASYRSEVFGRWPTAGTPDYLGSRAVYDDVVGALLATGGIDEPSKLYWDVRPSSRFSTLEFRVADVALTVDDAVLVAALTRSLVRTCHRAVVSGEPAPQVRPELLRAARWRAARYGLERDLIDVLARRAVPAREMVASFVAYLRPDLEEAGEADEVLALLEGVLARGTGARRQREVLEKTGAFEDVAAMIVEATLRGAA